MKMSKMLKGWSVIVLAVAMLVGGCHLFEGEQASPESTVRAYFEAFQRNDFGEAMALTVGGEDVSDDDLQMLENVFEGFEIGDFEVGETEMLSETEAEVEVTVTTIFEGDESVSSDRVRVVQQDGKWFIDDETQAPQDDPFEEEWNGEDFGEPRDMEDLLDDEEIEEMREMLEDEDLLDEDDLIEDFPIE